MRMAKGCVLGKKQWDEGRTMDNPYRESWYYQTDGPMAGCDSAADEE